MNAPVTHPATEDLLAQLRTTYCPRECYDAVVGLIAERDGAIASYERLRAAGAVCCKSMRDQLEAAQSTPVLSCEWALVPKDPTPSMVMAGAHWVERAMAGLNVGEDATERAWDAMVEAATENYLEPDALCRHELATAEVSEAYEQLAVRLSRMATDCQHGEDEASGDPATFVPNVISGFFYDDLTEAARIIRAKAQP